ncbi:nucleotidyl transferase AbiEii/AbiGii toxin family protein [Oleiharenicola lentus]|uniref:nucleotidyl transferase AbiEii/AbiGii toxin family protein n=1 Tax=Oleiharenicola lentus TaxID=2508720 RepID=UPI003F6762A2
MGPREQERWKNHILNEVFEAVAASDALRAILVFKGARVLNRRLDSKRVSLDLDSALSADYAMQAINLTVQAHYIETELQKALENHFSAQSPIRFTIERLSIKTSEHPLGWNAHTAVIRVRDARHATVLGLPPAEIDISAPELLSGHAVSALSVDHHHVYAYTLERIAGEKLRAFLSTLPAYRAKVKKPGFDIRVKDLYDLSLIEAKHPLRDQHFWLKAGEDFKLACASRYIDCQGLVTFRENWNATQKAYESDATLPKDVSFARAAEVLTGIVSFLESTGLIPFSHPLPAKSGAHRPGGG